MNAFDGPADTTVYRAIRTGDIVSNDTLHFFFPFFFYEVSNSDFSPLLRGFPCARGFL